MKYLNFIEVLVFAVVLATFLSFFEGHSWQKSVICIGGGFLFALKKYNKHE